MKNIIKLINNKRRSTVAKNFVSLSLLQAANYVFPLITLPYITRIFGPEIYGLIIFATSIIAYFTLIVNYGFDLSASRDIAQNRDDWEKVERIFNNVLFAKIFLFIISSLIFLIVVFAVTKINQYKVLYIIMFLGVGANVFFPTWFFQGIEKLNLTAIFTLIIRLVFTLLVFLIIRNKDDYLFYPITTLVGQIIVAVVSIKLIKIKFRISVKIPLFAEIWETLKTDAKIFYTTVVINLYTTTNFVILGFLASDYDVGIYSAANKVIMVVISLLSGPLSQSLFPSIGHSFSKSYDLGIKKIYHSLFLVILITIIPSILMFFLPSFIIETLFGVKFLPAITTLRILAFLPFIIGLSNIFGIQGLLNLRKDKEVTIITFIGAVLSIVLNVLLVPTFKFNGSALSLLITEIMITAMMMIVFWGNTDFRTDLKHLTKYITIVGK